MLDRLLSSAVEDEEFIVKAKALNLLALVTALVIVAYTLLTTIATPGQITIGAAIALGVGFVLSLGCFWLGKRGRVQLAAYLLFGGLFLAISFYMTDSANKISDLLMVPVLYILVSLPAGYIIHPHISLIVTTLAAVYMIGFLLLASPDAYTDFGDKASFWSNIGLAFAVSYILSAVAWVFGQGINQTLQRAQRQNLELQQITRELEAKRQLQASTGRKIQDLAERLAEYSARQARGSSRQAAAIAQVSTTIEELNQAAREIAKNASMVNEAAQQTLQGAQEGQDAIWMSSESMALIHAKATQGAQETTELGEFLQQIGRVAGIISNIASQIQLVAFNATLEAAEAGEAGRRFGVVATEVKDLAADSLKQAKQVAEIIRQVQEAGESVMALSGEQVRAVQTGSDTMSRSSLANQAIIGSADQMAQRAKQIQQTTSQQEQASHQVVSSIQEIRTVVDRWVVSSYQMDEMVTSLRSLAEQLV
jgi:methyl-accepting chemotaxis protein